MSRSRPFRLSLSAGRPFCFCGSIFITGLLEPRCGGVHPYSGRRCCCCSFYTGLPGRSCTGNASRLRLAPMSPFRLTGFPLPRFTFRMSSSSVPTRRSFGISTNMDPTRGARSTRGHFVSKRSTNGGVGHRFLPKKLESISLFRRFPRMRRPRDFQARHSAVSNRETAGCSRSCTKRRTPRFPGALEDRKEFSPQTL